MKQKYVISIIGGTGKEGRGLAFRWSKAGHHIIIGSRNQERAQIAAKEIASLCNSLVEVEGKSNCDAAHLGEIIVLTVPYSAHKEILSDIRKHIVGKLLIDVTVPLVPPKVTKVQMPPAGSALMEAKQILQEDVKVASAFHNISYENLMSDEKAHCDVLVCGESKEVRDLVIDLVSDTGLIGWDAGPIENSMVVEGLTSILIGINKRYGAVSAGIQITGVNRSS